MSIAALDSINPTATTVHLYLLSTAQPLARATAFVFGIFAANYLGGLLGVSGGGALVRGIAADGYSDLIDTGVRVVLGVALLIAGYHLYRGAQERRAVKRPKSLRPLHAFILGITITCAELPMALPYLTAMAILAGAGLGLAETASILLVYNLVLVSPLLVLLGGFLILRRSRSFWLERIGRAVSFWFPRLLPVFLGLLGGILVIEGLVGRLIRPFF
ncbi:GAP family protein [Methylococcus sp. Mc7]|uniref:GAP family protein n=1 Tax=Methylococcus sp. Mc7 TaxID=2860258 RepID=UPI001C52DB0B|nr:GAP family protein [Methylococcus sp. Mc7]QXP85718.1 GAP family protein [Methylococcus sp. Mc7]